jgi:hypothetical protein
VSGRWNKFPAIRLHNNKAIAGERPPTYGGDLEQHYEAHNGAIPTYGRDMAEIGRRDAGVEKRLCAGIGKLVAELKQAYSQLRW